MREDYPIGTKFFVTGKPSDREGGVHYLKCPHQWSFSVACAAESMAFLARLQATRR